MFVAEEKQIEAVRSVHFKFGYNELELKYPGSFRCCMSKLYHFLIV